MKAFFSPKSRLQVSWPLARLMNTLNLLGPALLLTAVLLLLATHLEDPPREVRDLQTAVAAVLVGVALAIRVCWGLAIRLIARRPSTTANGHAPIRPERDETSPADRS